jgi:hypothetical protein
MSGTNPGDPTPGNAIWSAPEPQAVLGLNSSMTYGSQMQFAVPANFQMAIGANYQFLVDPVGIMKGMGLTFPNALDALLGSGAYGNIQLTMGTATQLNMGRNYNIDLSPAREQTGFQTNTLSTPVEKGLCIAISIATIAYAVAYGIADDDDSRAILTMIYQGLMAIGADGILLAENANQLGYRGMWRLLNQALFRTAVPNDSTEWYMLALAELLVAVAIIIPPILDSVGEKHLDDAKAQLEGH